MSPLKILSEAEKIFYCRMVHILLLGPPTRMLYMLTGGWETTWVVNLIKSMLFQMPHHRCYSSIYLFIYYFLENTSIWKNMLKA